jgi:hypothetical protein
MCNCAGANGGTLRDQTDSEHIEALMKERADPRTSVGSGLFLVPDPEAGIREFKKIVIEDITYKDCTLRGEHCAAFKWIPYQVVSKDDVREFVNLCNSWCGFKARDERTGIERASNCPTGCLCFKEFLSAYGICR